MLKMSSEIQKKLQDDDQPTETSLKGSLVDKIRQGSVESNPTPKSEDNDSTTEEVSTEEKISLDEQGNIKFDNESDFNDFIQKTGVIFESESRIYTVKKFTPETTVLYLESKFKDRSDSGHATFKLKNLWDYYQEGRIWFPKQ